MIRTANPFYAARIAPQYIQARQALNVLDFFSGIGGFSLGLERAGFSTAAFCEIDPFCRSVLARHWPHVPMYDDINQLSARRLEHDRIPSIDLICGGYPCQPFSIAGKQRGEQDPRHLWPQMHRLIRELRPRWVVCENVAGHIELGLDAVLDDLDACGYTATTFVIPACAVGAPHRRDRVWIVAYAAGVEQRQDQWALQQQLASELPATTFQWDLPAPFTCGDNDGIPFRMERTQSLGNAVVPQIPELIGQAIMLHEGRTKAPRSCRWDFTRQPVQARRIQDTPSVKRNGAIPVFAQSPTRASEIEAVCTGTPRGGTRTLRN